MTVRVDDKEWRKLKRKLEDLPKMQAKVGVLASRGGNAAHGDSGISLIELAAIHEFGSPAAGIPERSFIRSAFKRNDPEVMKLAAKLGRKIIEGSITQEQALGVLGAWAAAEIKKNVTAGPHLQPKLKDATIAAKKSSRPLVDTGRLIGSINFEVVKG